MSEQNVEATAGRADEKPDPELLPAKKDQSPAPWVLTQEAPEVRHTVLRPLPLPPSSSAYRPIINERPVSRLNPFYLPRAKARTGLVLVTARSGARPVDLLGRRFAGRDVIWAGGTLYEVNLGLHHTSIHLNLPADDDTAVFRATAFLEWRVMVPQQVVKDNLLDVREALGPPLQARLGRITRRFAFDEIAAAERALAAELRRDDAGKPYGLETRIVLRLTADEKGSEYVAARRELHRAIELEDLRQRHRRQQQDHEQDLLRTRIDLYRSIVASGNVEQFALQLARKPEDVRAVVELLHQERDEERTRIAEFLTQLLESGAVDRWEVDDHVRDALEWLAQATRRAIRIADAATPTEEPVATSRNGSGAAPLD